MLLATSAGGCSQGNIKGVKTGFLAQVTGWIVGRPINRQTNKKKVEYEGPMDLTPEEISGGQFNIKLRWIRKQSVPVRTKEAVSMELQVER